MINLLRVLWRKIKYIKISNIKYHNDNYIFRAKKRWWKTWTLVYNDKEVWNKFWYIPDYLISEYWYWCVGVVWGQFYIQQFLFADKVGEFAPKWLQVYWPVQMVLHFFIWKKTWWGLASIIKENKKKYYYCNGVKVKIDDEWYKQFVVEYKL